jgi:hypothetical protein
MNFKLTKVELEGNSAVPKGSSSSAGNFTTLNFESKEQKDTPSLTDIEVGDMVFINGFPSWIKTSPISEIKSVSDNEIIFKTTTSIYELKKEESEEVSIQ